MEGFPFSGDPDDLMRSLREFEQQARSVRETQPEQLETVTLNTAVELTSAALQQVQASGSAEDRPRAARCDARAVPRSRRARLSSAAGLMRET